MIVSHPGLGASWLYRGGGPGPGDFGGALIDYYFLGAGKVGALIDYYFFCREKRRLGLGLVQKYPKMPVHRGAAGPENGKKAPQAPQK